MIKVRLLWYSLIVICLLAYRLASVAWGRQKRDAEEERKERERKKVKEEDETEREVNEREEEG